MINFQRDTREELHFNHPESLTGKCHKDLVRCLSNLPNVKVVVAFVEGEQGGGLNENLNSL